jgi:hypothetical protein
MSPISSIGPSSPENAAAIYQEYLNRLQALKQAAQANEEKISNHTVTTPAVEVNHDSANK